jgi:hypothetical protein
MLHFSHSRAITNMNERTKEREIKAHNEVERIPKSLSSYFRV